MDSLVAWPRQSEPTFVGVCLLVHLVYPFRPFQNTSLTEMNFGVDHQQTHKYLTDSNSLTGSTTQSFGQRLDQRL